MNHTRLCKLLLIQLAALAFFVAIAPLVQAGAGPSSQLKTGTVADGPGYDLTWSTVDAGGYTFSSGGSYTLGGTAGQPDPGLLAGGAYTLSGGFWAGSTGTFVYGVYLPLVVRNLAP